MPTGGSSGQVSGKFSAPSIQVMAFDRSVSPAIPNRLTGLDSMRLDSLLNSLAGLAKGAVLCCPLLAVPNRISGALT